VSPHEHTWRVYMTSDGCHAFGTDYACDCGAFKSVWHERARNTKYLLGADDWMDTECARCLELQAGAPVAPPSISIHEASS